MIAMPPLTDETGRVLISCREAAEIYGCGMRYIRRLVTDGRLHCVEVGRTYMVDEAEVRELAARDAAGRQRQRSEGFRPG
jgi:excisionase family DNA binding protein